MNAHTLPLDLAETQMMAAIPPAARSGALAFDLGRQGSAFDLLEDAPRVVVTVEGVHGHCLYTGFDDRVDSGGVFVATGAPLPRGARVALELDLDDGHRVCATAEVDWCREESPRGLPPGMGLRLLNPSLLDRLRMQACAARTGTLFYA